MERGYDCVHGPEAVNLGYDKWARDGKDACTGQIVCRLANYSKYYVQ
jgi:hypothetical protein